jgi:hypothetical protein
MNFIRHGLGRRLRHTLCVLLAGAMALAPVLSTAAESHEVTHASEADAHGGHHFHEAESHPRQAEHDDMSDAGGLLHGLTHAVHACAHAFAILTGFAPVTGVPTAVIQLPDTGLTPGDAPRTHPFRPPIA